MREMADRTHRECGKQENKNETQPSGGCDQDLNQKVYRKHRSNTKTSKWKRQFFKIDKN